MNKVIITKVIWIVIRLLWIINITDSDYDFQMTYVEDYKERIKMPLHFETSEFQKKTKVDAVK